MIPRIKNHENQRYNEETRSKHMIIITDFFVALEIRGKKYNYYTSSILKYFEEYENVMETIFWYRIRAISHFPSVAYKKIKGDKR